MHAPCLPMRRLQPASSDLAFGPACTGGARGPGAQPRSTAAVTVARRPAPVRDMRGNPDPLPPGALPIVGFDVAARAWMVDSAAPGDRAPLPLLRGHLQVDVAAQIRAAEDGGRPARGLIAAALLPGVVDDIVRMMCFCDQHEIVMVSAHAAIAGEPSPIVRIHADALGRQRPMLRVVGSGWPMVAHTWIGIALSNRA